MKKLLYSKPGKILVIAIMLAAASCIAVSAAWAFSGLRVNMRYNILYPKSYEASAEVVSDYLVTETYALVTEQADINRYCKDDKLDLSETIDISDLNAGIAKTDKTPALTYTLADLNAFYESAGYVYLSWMLNNSESLRIYGPESPADEEYGTEIDDFTRDSQTIYGPQAVSTSKNVVTYDDAIYGLWEENINTSRPRNGDDRNTFLCYPELYNILYNNGLPLEQKYLKNASGGTIAEYAQQNLETFSILDAYTNLVNVAKKVHGLTQSTVSSESNAMIWLKNVETGAVYTNIDGWDSKTLAQVQTDYTAHISAGTKTAQSSDRQDADTECFLAYDGTTKTTDYSAPAPASKNDYYQSEELLMLRDHALSNANEFLGEGSWQIFVGLDTTYAANDTAKTNAALYDEFAKKQPFGHHALPAAIIAAIIFFAMLILTVIQTGHRPEDADRTATEPDCNLPEYQTIKYPSRRIGVHTTQMERFPIELLVVIDIILWIILFAIIVSLASYAGNFVDTNYSDTIPRAFNASGYERMLPRLYMILIPAAIAAASLLCWNLKHFIRRFKARTLGASLIKSLVLAVSKVTHSVYRTKEEGQRLVIIYALIALVNAVIAGICGLLSAAAGVFFPIIICVVVLVIINIAILRKLMTFFSGRDAVRKGMDEIAAGNLNYKVDVEEISGYNREMAEGVNKVSAGFKHAVENEMKSERLKTELITNVSHDIKTPLTSIINYVDILKRHDIDDDEVRSYVEILERKSARLKQLVDDLVESSKISSGNITLDLHTIDLGQLIQQMNGEFREKFEERNLSIVCELPEEPMLIKADGARLCRVIENLYNNAAKYSLTGSRIYINGAIRSGSDPYNNRIVFTIRNISEHALNISADELTERFVRGDLSRNTEGSGLGLEIARNLTIMQGGTFDIILDGDLFKVVITFPTVK